MTPDEAEARAKSEHRITVKPQDNYMFPWIAACGCNWQAACRNKEEGEYYRNLHLNAQAHLLIAGGLPQGHL